MKIKWELLAATVALAPLVNEAVAQGQVGPLNTVQCNKLLIQAAGTATQQRLMTGNTSQIIYLCGWDITNTGSGGSFQILQGQGTNCSTNNGNITASMQVSSNAPNVDHLQYAQYNVPQTTSATANDLCINVTSGVAAILYVGQY